jgi:hypothetical protein
MRRILLPLIILALLAASAVFVLGQDNPPTGERVGLLVTVSNKTCHMETGGELGTPEASATAETTLEAASVAVTEEAPTAPYTVLTLGSDCDEARPYLTVPSNDVLWIGFAIPNEPARQKFTAVPGDEHPPKFDKRGQFIGCTIPLRGEQICRALWENAGTTYQIEIPITVRSAYIAPIAATNTPAQPAVSTAAPIPVSTPNSGVWGSCGSCTTCGGPVEHCVLAPDNTCVWDAARCEHRRPGDN